MKATAAAHPNIALVKYWGKRDEVLILPHTGSLSMTLDRLTATTTVEFSGAGPDQVRLDGRDLGGADLARVVRVLDLVRARARIGLWARVASVTDFPKAAGLASSAAGGAALAAAASRAAGLSLDARELSLLARRASGSACRSVEGGFCEWRRGEAADGSDCFAVQVADPFHWRELRMVVAVCAEQEKEVSSRDGMRRCVATSPYYPAWVAAVEGDLVAARSALEARDLEALGSLAELNALRMHALTLSADPPLVYLRPATLAVLGEVAAMRAGGLLAYFTLDAGPNPVVLCLAQSVPAVQARLSAVAGVSRMVAAGPGAGVEAREAHLF